MENTRTCVYARASARTHTHTISIIIIITKKKPFFRDRSPKIISGSEFASASRGPGLPARHKTKRPLNA